MAAEVMAKPRIDLRRYLTPLGTLVGVAVIVGGVIFLADPKSAANLLASFYDLLGNTAGADALRNGTGDQFYAKLILAVIALAVGVGGVWMVYAGASSFVSLLKPRLQARIIPWVFVVPALALLGIYLVYSTVATVWTSFVADKGFSDNYGQLLDDKVLSALGNNVIWLIVGTGGSVILGLIIAGMVDRVRREALAKTFIFLPLAISLVGASVIWRFIYTWQPAGHEQYGLLNAVWTAFGLQPVDWIHNTGQFLGLPFVGSVDTYALIVIMVWLQTGFAMVVLSAAIKGVSVEVIEAARLDGAGERQIFFQVIVPIIRGSIITVATTIAIAVLKIFDIVYVMTGGRFNTDVVANQMFIDKFQFFQDGHAAALATVLFIAVLPLMFLNLRNLRQQGVGT
jgi:alpha-glucoside transport system permease protein